MSARGPLGYALRQALILAALAIIPAAAAWAMMSKPAEGTVDPVRASSWGKSVLWIDARRASEYEAAHVPGALRLYEAQWDELAPEVLQRWTPGQKIVVYCDGGDCQASKQVAAKLRDMGLSPVFVLNGGWPQWVKEMGRPAK